MPGLTSVVCCVGLIRVRITMQPGDVELRGG
jgi:hypothetical protein